MKDPMANFFCSPIFAPFFLSAIPTSPSKIDKNSLWGGSIIQKDNCVSREFAHKILCLFGGLFSGDAGDFRGRGGERAFSTIWRGSSGVFEAHPGTPVPCAPHLYSLRLKISVPAIVRVSIKGIVIHGELGFNDFGLVSRTSFNPNLLHGFFQK